MSSESLFPQNLVHDGGTAIGCRKQEQGKRVQERGREKDGKEREGKRREERERERRMRGEKRSEEEAEKSNKNWGPIREPDNYNGNLIRVASGDGRREREDSARLDSRVSAQACEPRHKSAGAAEQSECEQSGRRQQQQRRAWRGGAWHGAAWSSRGEERREYPGEKRRGRNGISEAFSGITRRRRTACGSRAAQN